MRFLRVYWRAIADNFGGILLSWGYSVLSASFYLPKEKTMVLSLIGLLVVVPLAFLINALIQLRRYRVKVTQKAAFGKTRALVVTAGRSPALIALLLREMNPDFVGLVCTPGDNGSERPAREALRQWGKGNVGENVWLATVNPGDAQSIMEGTSQLLRWLETDKGVPRAQILLDVTGGFTVLSLGASAAARNYGVRTQCAIPHMDPVTNQPQGIEKVVTIA